MTFPPSFGIIPGGGLSRPARFCRRTIAFPPYDPLCPPPTASAWVRRFAPLVATGGRVLDLAAGRGRHARFFLDRGARVACVDRDIGGHGDLAETAEIVAADLGSGSGWPLAGRQFEAIVVVNYFHRPLLAALLA